MKCYITPMRMTTIKRKAITSVSENVDKWEPSYIAVKYVNVSATSENDLEVLNV